MIEAFRKIWQFSGKERGNINKSVGVSVVNALLQMCQVGAIYLVVLGLTGGSTAKSVAVLALVLVLVSIFGGVVASSYSKQLQTHAGYFMAADRRISIADKLKSVPMGYFNESSLGQLSGVCTSVVGAIESMVPMVLVNILGGLITTAVFTVIILLFDWRIGLIVLAGVGMMLAAILLWQGGTMTLAKALMVLVMSFMVFNQIKAFGMGVSMLRMAAASIDRTVETEQMPKMDEHGKAIAPAKHDIVFDHVDFSYEHKQILHDVSLSIPAGRMTALVDPSGSGKSTLCSLMARFWDVDSGSVKIGGVDVRDYTLESLMDQISMVFQNVYLFADTIENNIKFGCPDATHEQVVEAARKACCDDFIEALPDGYNTVIGGGGAHLSGGEKQRIAIARAMLKDAPIVILDEATANVDPENEDRLQKAIEALTRDKTIIMIAHRLKTVRHADQILVVDHGRIVQQGTHEQLIGQPGIYAAFVGGRQQAEGWKL